MNDYERIFYFRYGKQKGHPGVDAYEIRRLIILAANK